MPDREIDFLIVGGGIAGASCAETLREEGADGSILVVGREPDPPYHRPPLSKGYLRGEQGREDTLLRPEAWWKERDVELLVRTSVMKLDPGRRTVRLSTKEEVRFGRGLLATGANVRRLRVDGSELAGIHYLRALGNSDAIRTDADAAGRVVVIGGSYIACEVAATLAARGTRCTMVMQEEVPLEGSFGPEIGRFFQGVLERHGVDVLGGDELERLEGDGERVGKVVTSVGCELDAECVVIGARVVPDVCLPARPGWSSARAGGSPARPGSRRAPSGSSLPGTWRSTPRHCSGGRCGSSTGTSPASRGAPRRTTCSVAMSRTRRFPISGPISPTGRPSST